ncbi:hypothetical protein QLH52_20270 [Methylomonas sp. OY6]|uniref:Proteolipid membrane potential modulator n=1 Tax=Methylomonas defluvii TaxID=3045149 RepID=A0ABU4ULC2_9GAMM|nr:hypothetical protein [Methylomonas sp. OY6]MDX8129642.1 hypothetical protein [Methylomonas sp. OY6]
MNWQYLLSGGLALYIVETAGSNHSDVAIAIVAFLVCLIPDIIYGLLSLARHEYKPAKHFFN